MSVLSTVINKVSGFYKRPGCLGWFVRGLSFMVLLAIMGSIYQKISMARDWKLYPPPGQLVDVGGYQMHLYCIGEGGPTVVLEAGSGNKGVVAWSFVQEKMAANARVCSYDRPGMGWSEPDPANEPRYSPQVAETLHTLLHNAGIEAPYVLVGHSAGGLHVRNFAYLYPKDVTGMVLLDATPDNVYLTIMPIDPTGDFFENVGWKYCHLMTAIGVERLFGETKIGSLFGLPTSERGRYPLPELIYQADLANRNRTHYCRSSELEFRANRIDGTRSEPPQSLGDLPLLVVTVGTDPAWNEIQNVLAALSTDSTHIVIEDGDHYLQFFQPDVVIDAVDQMVTKVRAKQ